MRETSLSELSAAELREIDGGNIGSLTPIDWTKLVVIVEYPYPHPVPVNSESAK